MRRIDADALREDWLENGENEYVYDTNAVLESLDAAPTVDAVPVVRCRDCRHRDPEDHKCDCGENERQGCPFPVDDDYFCKYGAR